MWILTAHTESPNMYTFSLIAIQINYSILFLHLQYYNF